LIAKGKGFAFEKILIVGTFKLYNKVYYRTGSYLKKGVKTVGPSDIMLFYKLNLIMKNVA
jgi:hypothetical protein